MDRKSEHAGRWIDKARSDLLNADNNLAVLEKILKHDPSAESLRQTLALLNPYSVEVRYPGDAWMPTAEDAKEARKAAQEVFEWMQSRLERLFE